MVDLNQSYLMQQQELLREIRDEIRSSRGGGMAGGAMPASPAAARPSAAFMRAQLAMDQGASQAWASFGWTDAYKTEVSSSIPNSILASMGLRRAPANMTQWEFQEQAAELGWGALAQIPGRALTPGVTRRIDTRARFLHDQSSRFLRAGDAGAGLFGHGADISEARAMSRMLERDAMVDMRFNPGDYSTIMESGMRSGQFDFAQSMTDLKQQFDSLKDTIGDLTRVTRMSTDQISQSMGAMRQFGIIDPADQARAIMQIDASARVAGVSSAEMAQTVQGAMGRAVAVGMHAGGAGGLAAGNLATVRAMSRAGIISPAVVAAGGGAQTISEQITGAQQAFLGSEMGLLMMAGGLGRGAGAPEALFGTLGRMGGLEGYMGLQANRIDLMNQLTRDPGAMQRAHLGYVNMQLGMMGIQDPTSTQGQHAAFMLLRGQMGDAAATTYVRQNFTVSGQIQQAHTQLATMDYTAQREAALAHDYSYLQDSPMARMRRTFVELGAMPGRFTTWVAGMGDATGADRYRRQARGLAAGIFQDQADPLDSAAAIGRVLAGVDIGDDFTGARRLRFRGDTNYGTRAGGIMGGAVAGAALGAKYGVPFFGWGGFVGAGVGAAVGAGIAATGLWGYDSVTDPYSDVAGADVRGFAEFQMAAGRRIVSPRGQELARGANPALSENSEYRALLQESLDFRSMTPAKATELQARVARIAGSTKESVSDVVASLRAMGASFNLEGFLVEGVRSETQVVDHIADALSGTEFGGAALAEGRGARALHTFYQAMQSGTGVDAARQALFSGFGADAQVQDSLWNAFRQQSASDRQATLGTLDVMASRSGDRAVSRRFDTLRQYALSLLTSPEDEYAASVIREQSGSEFIRSLVGGGPGSATVHGALRGEALLGQIIGLGEMDAGTLMGMGARELSGLTGGALGVGVIEQLRRTSAGDADMFRQGLLGAMMDPATVEQVAGQTSVELKVSENLYLASTVLRKIVQDLKLPTSGAEEE